jgi:ParB family chromosome partitioning protein
MDIGTFLEIPCSEIRLFRTQPRTYFHPERMLELKSSIKLFGQKKPGLVRPIAQQGLYKYELVDGERRFKICTELGFKFKAEVKEFKDEKEQFLEAILQNYGGEGHSELEILEAIKKLRKDFDFTLEQTAGCFGKSIGWVQNYLALNKLHPDVLALMSPELPDNERLSFSRAFQLVGLAPALQIKLGKKSVGMSVKEAKFMVQRYRGPKDTKKSPRVEYEKLNNFLRRTMIDLELFSQRPDSYYQEMFEYRDIGDVEASSSLLLGSIEKIKLIRIKLGTAKKMISKGTGDS